MAVNVQGLKICETCNKGCQLLETTKRPESSEWYCENCHKSYAVERNPYGEVVG